MIPVSLRMRNFMPYRGDTPPLSFKSIHTACISGDNGAGKSSIIDAITWALWGKSRAESSDDLIHQGENETQVEFDFTSGGQLYRIIRKHARPKSKRASGPSSLDLFTASDCGFVPISGDNKTQTQTIITRDILHMDYETFTNSAYLRQGHADEFTRKEPGKRKEVLANILGLSVYDEYEASAKEKAREAEQAKLLLSASISEHETELSQKPAYEAELKQAEVSSTEIYASVSQKETGLKQLRSEVQALEGVRTQLSQLDAAIKRHNEDFRREEERLKQSTVHVVEYQKIMDDRTAIESGYQELQKVRNLHDEMNQQARQLSRLSEKKNQYEKARDLAQNDLNTQHKLIENNIQQLDARAVKLPELKLEQQKLLPVQRALVSLEAEIESKRKDSLDKKDELSRLVAGISRLKQDVTDIDEKLGLLSETVGGAHCPLCETDLGNEKLELVESKYACEKQEKLTSIKRTEGDSITLSAEAKSLDAEINRLEARQKQENYAFTIQESRITQTIKESAEASSSLEGERQKLAQVEETLATQDYARACLLYTSPSPRDRQKSRMPSSA